MASGDIARRLYLYAGQTATYGTVAVSVLYPMMSALTVNIGAGTPYRFTGKVPLAYHDIAGSYVRQALNVDSGAFVVYTDYSISPGAGVYQPVSWEYVFPADKFTPGNHTFLWYVETGASYWRPYFGTTVGSGNYGPVVMTCEPWV